MQSTYVRQLRRLHKFDFCLDEELIAMLAVCDECKHAPGDVVFSEGDRGDAFYVILEGRYGVEKRLNGKTHEVAVLEPGAVVGEMGILDVENPTRSADVVAREPGTMLRMCKTHLDEAVEDGAPWAAKLMAHFAQVLAARLRELDEAYRKLLQETKGKVKGVGELEAFHTHLLEKWQL